MATALQLTDKAKKLANAGQFENAIALLKQSLSLDPNQPEAWRHIGYISIFGTVDFATAVEALAQSLTLDPVDAQTYYLMGYVSQQMNQIDDLIELFRIGLEYDPSHVEMLSFLGMGYLYKRKFDDAKMLVLQALSLKPDNIKVFLNALNIAEILPLDDFERAQITAAIKKVEKLPAFKENILLFEAKELFSEKQYDEAKKRLSKIKDNIEQLGAAKNFLLGDIARREGDHDSAHGFYAKANRMQKNATEGRRYKLETITNLIDDTLTLLDQNFSNDLETVIEQNKIERPYPDPVFLIGFPRSGTTLTGKILDTHPQLFTADEFSAIDQIKVHMQQQYGLDLPRDIPKLTSEHLAFMHNLYNLKQSGLPAAQQDHIFIDKMPLNTLHVPIIHALFPNARFIYVTRHPLDSVLSSFMQYFALNAAMYHFLDIETAAHLYKKTRELWLKEKEILPLKYHELRYENLVNNFDEEVGKMLEFIGVPWNDAVHEFYKERADGPTTLSPSRTQITGKLTSEPQGRWKKYRPHLEKAIEVLEPVITELGYDLDKN